MLTTGLSNKTIQCYILEELKYYLRGTDSCFIHWLKWTHVIEVHTGRSWIHPVPSCMAAACFFLSPWIISRMLWYRNFAGNWQEHYPTLGLYSLRLPFLSWTYVFHSVRISFMTKPIYKISEEAHKMYVCSSLLSNETPLQLSQLISPLWSLQSLRYSL